MAFSGNTSRRSCFGKILALALLIMMALQSASVRGAAESPVGIFKADLSKAVGSKRGVVAARTAARTIAKHLRKDAGGDPDKIKTFTKLAIMALRQRKANEAFVVEWSRQVMRSYFTQGVRHYDVSDRKFLSALTLVYKLVKVDDATAQSGFAQLAGNNQRLGGSAEDAQRLWVEVYNAYGVIEDM